MTWIRVSPGWVWLGLVWSAQGIRFKIREFTLFLIRTSKKIIWASKDLNVWWVQHFCKLLFFPRIQPKKSMFLNFWEKCKIDHVFILEFLSKYFHKTHQNVYFSAKKRVLSLHIWMQNNDNSSIQNVPKILTNRRSYKQDQTFIAGPQLDRA